MKKIVYGLFFGDSITYGEYDGVFGLGGYFKEICPTEIP
jgi:hypothetical protein